jgi:hypothetical protein
MAIKMYERAILTVDLPADGLRSGDVGTVVERHEAPGVGVGYSVEFFDMTGQTVAVVTAPESIFREPTPQDLPSVRVTTVTH